MVLQLILIKMYKVLMFVVIHHSISSLNLVLPLNSVFGIRGGCVVGHLGVGLCMDRPFLSEYELCSLDEEA